MPRFAAILAALVFVLGGSPSGALAQTRLIPQVGVYSAVQDPGSVRGVNGAYEIGRYESTLAYGAALEVGASRAVAFRLGGLYAPEAQVPISGVGCGAGCLSSVDLLSLNASLVVSPLGRILFLEPYVVGGGGIKRYDFEPQSLGSGVGPLFDDGSEWAGLLGIGAELDLGGALLDFEVTDHFHWSKRHVPGQDRDRVDDFFFTVGVVLGGH